MEKIETRKDLMNLMNELFKYYLKEVDSCISANKYINNLEYELDPISFKFENELKSLINSFNPKYNSSYSLDNQILVQRVTGLDCLNSFHETKRKKIESWLDYQKNNPPMV